MSMKLLFVSLGCDKNLVDSEKMLGLLADQGFSFTDDEREAEVDAAMEKAGFLKIGVKKEKGWCAEIFKKPEIL